MCCGRTHGACNVGVFSIEGDTQNLVTSFFLFFVFGGGGGGVA